MKRYTARNIVEDFFICAFIACVGIGVAWVVVNFALPPPTPQAVAQVSPQTEQACRRCSDLCREIGIVIRERDVPVNAPNKALIKQKEVEDGEGQREIP